MGGWFGPKASEGAHPYLPPALQAQLRADPENLELMNQVEAHLGGDLARLIDTYRDLAKNDPGFTLGLARVYMKAGKPSLALVQLRKRAREAPQRQVFLELAQAYEALDKPDLARQAREQAQQARP